MDQDAKKTALRMIPYGIYVLTADDGKGNVAAATVNWVTQTAFNPPLVVAGVKTDSGAYQIIKDTKTFALNMLLSDQKGAAFTFFKPTKLEDGKLSGQAIHKGSTGAPILDAAPALYDRFAAMLDKRRRELDRIHGDGFWNLHGLPRNQLGPNMKRFFAS